MAEVPACERQETAVRGNAEDGLGHAQGDHLGVGEPAAVIAPPHWQKIVGCAINVGAESVEVGVHRGLRVDGVLDTADFGLSASFSLDSMVNPVESII